MSFITACKFTHEEEALLCYHYKKKIILLNQTFAAILQLQCQPWDIAVADSNTTVFSVPDKKQTAFHENQTKTETWETACD